MEKKEPIKVSLSTFFLMLAIVVIAVMGYFMFKLYNEKTTTEKKVTDLNSQINILQEKINSISKTINSDDSKENISTNKTTQNTTTNNSNEVKYDVEITPYEVANLYKEWQVKGNDMNVFKEFNSKYIGKIVKVIGNVNYYGISNGKDYDYCINLVDNSFDRVYATCLTNDTKLGLKEGQKLTIIGEYSDDINIMTLKNIKIIEE